MRLTLAWLRNVVVVALSFALALYFVVAFGQQAWRARQLEAQVAERRAALAELVAERDALARQLSQLEGDAYRAYVERTARRELNLTYPGETVLLVQWREATPAALVPTPTPLLTTEPNWVRWLEVLRLPQP
ncbi:septum formation initiator family protein [Thermomicrobium sp. CFH 73360]|uniref:FtsB family cell division protein n=1 Tax=Thermomicrobium sp. CFH 73360 TaxID=2951987 RepID=UPI0020773A02|nr:septum formation initiator family protein [Thermomicrobium sp. CFH 73360]MCM8746178.1 septum formation initiator family protein [Thermomicrobium sp. CFH 73360]